MGLLDIDRQATQARLTRDVGRSKYGMLNDDNPIQKSTYGGMYGSLMQDPADKERMDREMWQNTLAMMPIAGMTTYHGSPHIFNKFRMDKIGTGEGAQAYGHGLYLAENPSVAKGYAEKLGADYNWKKIRENVNLDFDRGYVAKRPDGTEKVFTNESDAIRWVEDVMSNLYKVDLPDEQIKNMLDWDNIPLSKQPEIVRESLKDATSKLPENARELGRNAYAKLSEILGGADKASAYLNSKGVPGIKYFDQGSRGGATRTVDPAIENELMVLKNKLVEGIPKSSKEYEKISYRVKILEKIKENTEQGTRNFVVFDENIPKILERNQQPIGGLLDK